MSNTSPSKRQLDSSEPPAGAKKAMKVHPFFQKPGSSSPPLQWISSGGLTYVHGVHLEPKNMAKVAAFDFDGTIIKGRTNIKWWAKGVPLKLKQLHDAGYSIVIVSNQLQGHRSAIPTPEWKQLIGRVASNIPDVPFRIFASTAKDGFRKPMPGIWYELERIFQEDNVTIDKTVSFFVGDAAGRSFDFADSDRKWALNVEIAFHTPQEYFLKTHPSSFVLKGFHVSTLPQLPRLTPASEPIITSSSESKPEVVVFCGFPAMGKTSFFRHHFMSNGYMHVNQDTLKTMPKCLSAVEQALASGKSCVVDNTNRDQQTRKPYLDLARKFRVSARCFLFAGSMELAWHNNLYRAYNLPDSPSNHERKRDLLPFLAFLRFKESYEEPTLSEGFSEVRTVNFVFEGTAEEKRRWQMWLQLS